MREMDRERTHLQQQEKKIIIEIKKMAKEQQMVGDSFMAQIFFCLCVFVCVCPCSVAFTKWFSVLTLLPYSMVCPFLRAPFLRVFFVACRRWCPRIGKQGAAKIMAKDLVRTRQQIQKFYEMKSHLQAVSLKIQTLKSTAAMADAMKVSCLNEWRWFFYRECSALCSFLRVLLEP